VKLQSGARLYIHGTIQGDVKDPALRGTYRYLYIYRACSLEYSGRVVGDVLRPPLERRHWKGGSRWGPGARRTAECSSFEGWCTGPRGTARRDATPRGSCICRGEPVSMGMHPLPGAMAFPPPPPLLPISLLPREVRKPRGRNGRGSRFLLTETVVVSQRVTGVRHVRILCTPRIEHLLGNARADTGEKREHLWCSWCLWPLLSLESLLWEGSFSRTSQIPEKRSCKIYLSDISRYRCSSIDASFTKCLLSGKTGISRILFFTFEYQGIFVNRFYQCLRKLWNFTFEFKFCLFLKTFFLIISFFIMQNVGNWLTSYSIHHYIFSYIYFCMSRKFYLKNRDDIVKDNNQQKSSTLMWYYNESPYIVLYGDSLQYNTTIY